MSTRSVILRFSLVLAAPLFARESTDVIVILSSRRSYISDTTGRCAWRAQAGGHLAVLMAAPRGWTTPRFIHLCAASGRDGNGPQELHPETRPTK